MVGVGAGGFILEPDLLEELAKLCAHRFPVVHLGTRPHADFVPRAGQSMIIHGEKMLTVQMAHSGNGVDTGAEVTGIMKTSAGLALSLSFLAVKLKWRRTVVAKQRLIDGTEQPLLLQKAADHERERIPLVRAVVPHAVPVLEDGRLEFGVDGARILFRIVDSVLAGFGVIIDCSDVGELLRR